MASIRATSLLVLVGLVLIIGYSAMPMPAGQLNENLKNSNNENELGRMKREANDKLKAGDQKLKGGNYYYGSYYDSYDSYDSYNSYYDSYYDSYYYDSYYDYYYRK
jgi:hypothetical protein